jgi:putative DNA-invertase from lambdoid prophage Rac
MAVYSYTRVSTQTQADEGESLGAQQRRVEGYAQMIDLTVDRHFVERGVSGSVPLSQRPQGAALLTLVQLGDTIITPKLDRMFRSSLDALDVLSKLKERGVSLHMIDLGGDVTGNGISKLVFTILSAVAEAERDRIRERIADVKKDQKQRGRYLGGKVPFGYEVGADGALVEIPEQQTAIHEMVRLRKSGSPLRLIASVMKSRGHNISHVAVKDILERAMREDVVAPVR